MTAEQAKIAEEMTKLQAELSALESVTPEGDDAIKAHSEQSERCIKALDGLTARANLANRLADARAAAEAVKPATNAAGVVVPAPAPAPVKRSAIAHPGRVQGFDSAEAAENAGRFLRSLARGELRGDFSRATEEPNSMGELSPTYDGKGSELVTYELYRGIINLLTYSSTCVQVVSTYQVNTNGMYLPIAEMTEEAEFYLENCEIKPVKVDTRRAVLDLKKIGARAQVSNELIEDAYISVASLVASQFAYAFAKKIDKTWLLGDAAAGIDGLISQIPAANVITAPANLTPTALAGVVAAVNPNARSRQWVVSPEGWGKIMGVSAAAIGASIADSVRPVIYGAPVYQCLEMPGDTLALYGDFASACAMGYKPSGLQVAASTDRAFEYDQVVYRATARYAWSNHSPSYVVQLKK
jgi:HK97 family phage major capsid protein